MLGPVNVPVHSFCRTACDGARRGNWGVQRLIWHITWIWLGYRGIETSRELSRGTSNLRRILHVTPYPLPAGFHWSDWLDHGVHCGKVDAQKCLAIFFAKIWFGTQLRSTTDRGTQRLSRWAIWTNVAPSSPLHDFLIDMKSYIRYVKRRQPCSSYASAKQWSQTGQRWNTRQFANQLAKFGPRPNSCRSVHMGGTSSVEWEEWRWAGRQAGRRVERRFPNTVIVMALILMKNDAVTDLWWVGTNRSFQDLCRCKERIIRHRTLRRSSEHSHAGLGNW